MIGSIQLDWGDTAPPPSVREQLEARVCSSDASGPRIGLRKTPSGYEARLDGEGAAELRLRDPDLSSVVTRAIEMIAIVERTERERARSGDTLGDRDSRTTLRP